MKTIVQHATIVTAAAAAMLLPPPSVAFAQCEIDIIYGPQGFGTSRALEGDTMAVGRKTGPPVAGTLYLFDRVDGAWVLDTILESPSSPPTGFGSPIVLQDDVFVTGDYAYPGDLENLIFHGAAFVYRRAGGQWELEATLLPPDPPPPPALPLIGYSVAIDGDVVLAGAPQHDVGGVERAGTVYVFRNGADGWQYETMLTGPDPIFSDRFGISVALKGDLALIGAHLNPGPGNLTGAAFIFRYDGTEWVFEQKLKPPGGETGQKWFGWSVALDASANVAAIGAVEDGPQNGAVYIFRFEGESWEFEQKLMAENPVGLAPGLGGSVAMDRLGNVVLSSGGGDSEAGWEAGAVHVFRHDDNEWHETMKIFASDASAGDHFGDVVIWGDEAVITALGAQQAYHFTGILGIDCNESGQSDACDIFFGDSTDSSGDGIPDECAADLNGDGKVGVVDLLILLAAWGECEDCTPAVPGDPPTPGGCPADLNGDCAVGVEDLLILLQNWG